MAKKNRISSFITATTWALFVDGREIDAGFYWDGRIDLDWKFQAAQSMAVSMILKNG